MFPGGTTMKKFVVDGHNLIPKIRGLQLSDPEDENKLISILQEYCIRERCLVELFFDGAQPGFKTRQKIGLVHIHWVRTGLIADDAILNFLRHQGKRAQEYNVVSSDRRVQSEAQALGARGISADQFAVDITNTLSNPRPGNGEKEPELTSEEIEEWLKVFKK